MNIHLVGTLTSLREVQVHQLIAAAQPTHPPHHKYIVKCCPTLSFSNLGKSSDPDLWLLGNKQIPVLEQGDAAKWPKTSTITSQLGRQATW